MNNFIELEYYIVSKDNVYKAIFNIDNISYISSHSEMVMANDDYFKLTDNGLDKLNKEIARVPNRLPKPNPPRTIPSV